MLLQDKGIDGMDFTNIAEGNPGIGGTEYLFLLLLYYLPDLNITVYHYNNNVLPSGTSVLISSEKEALDLAQDGIFILKNLQSNEMYELMKSYNLKYILWCHNYLTAFEMDYIVKEENVKRAIAVGRQMYDYYIDDVVINKMDYVFNIFSPSAENKLRTKNYEPWVTYVGSLIYQKSFHVLADCWKQVIKEVPEAKLHVIGTGKLYDRNNKLGKLGIAEASYEEMFLKNLCDDNGELLDSVVFHGLMGNDKFDVYKNTAVGVANPLSSTETFCLCAIEMESAGIPVVSRRKNGLLDTVIDGETGLLYKDTSMLAEYIIKLLKDKELNNKLGEQASVFASKAFNPDEIIPEWLRVFNEVENDKKAKYHKPTNHFDNNGKRVRMLFHFIHKFPLLKLIPSIHDVQKK